MRKRATPQTKTTTTTRPLSADRRRALIGAGAAMFVAASGGVEARARDSEDGRRPEIEGQTVPFRIRLPEAGRFAPDQIVVLTLDAVLAGPAPRNAVARGGSRLDLSGVPLVNGLVRRQPAAAVVTPANRIGPMRRAEDALIMDLRRAPVDARALLSRPVAAISSFSGAPILEIEALLTLEPTGADAPLTHDAPGEPIGFVYLQGGAREGRLVLSPPRRALFGLF